MPAGEAIWQTAGGSIAIDRPLIVGILNITPDSFWDGGRLRGREGALTHAQRLLDEGADILDVGGESTRPGATPVPEAREIDRVVPFIEAAVRRWPSVPLSLDTVKAGVASAGLDAGAWIINDVSGLRLDPGLADLVARRNAGLVVMHSRGGVADMARYESAEYGPDPVAEMVAELARSLDVARRAGVAGEAIVVDPGLGFSKRTEHSVAAIAGLARFLALGRPVMVGPSRKRFVGELGGGAAGPLPVEDRLDGTLAACAVALLGGARLFRVHDVGAVRRALAVAEAIRRAA